MYAHQFRWLRLSAIPLITACALPHAMANTDFNEAGKQMSLMLQNFHYSKMEFSDELSARFLDIYLKKVDPAKIFFTQEQVDFLKSRFASELDDYLLSKTMLEAADYLYKAYEVNALRRFAYAKELIKKEKFTFDSNRSVERSRKKLKSWPKDEAEMAQVWHDLIENELLSELLRRETISRLAKEQNKPDPTLKEKPALEKLLMRYDRLEKTIKDVDQEEIVETFLGAVALAYDPHTDYWGARQMERFQDSMNTELIGIGALLGAEDDGSTKINGIVANGPAEKSGELKLGDRIVGVDSNNTGEMVDILYMKLDKVVDLIRGKENSEVRLKVEPADGVGPAKIIVIKRAKVPMKDELAKAKIIEIKGASKDKDRIGIITLPSFYASMTDDNNHSCASDVEALIQRMNNENVDGIIIDLRNNGGGSLEAVRQMSGFFTGPGPVVQIKDTRGHISSQTARKKAIFNGPIVVMTDKLSASASEILAAALQDYGKAVIIGNKTTFGKGTVQRPISIAQYMPFFSNRERAGVLKVTTQKFYRVAGGSTQLKGVESDIVLPSVISAYDVGEASLDYAMEYDKIPKSPYYSKDAHISEILPELRLRSSNRVALDPDFRIIQEESNMLKKRIDDNKVSLNKATRQSEMSKLEARRKEINKERKVRFAEMAKADALKFNIYRLNLDDINAKSLPLADPDKDKDTFMKTAEDPTEQLDDSPDYPSGLDPELREGINILRDMLELS